ncbi:MAG: universal stress protein [Thermodesulfobacteriota bacterium]
MLPVKKILCPTDFSEPSFVGVKGANELAAHFSAELILVHVVTPVHVYPGPYPAAGFDLEGHLEEMIGASHKSLEEVVKNKTTPDLQVQTRVLQGSPADQIVEVAGSEEVDVIVTATHGWTGWRRYIFGSVAEKVVRLATCPVLTVPAPQG